MYKAIVLEVDWLTSDNAIIAVGFDRLDLAAIYYTNSCECWPDSASGSYFAVLGEDNSYYVLAIESAKRVLLEIALNNGSLDIISGMVTNEVISSDAATDYFATTAQ